MPQDPAAIESIFHAAVATRDPAERALLLADACGTDTPLRARIERLLAAHAEAEAHDRPAERDISTWARSGDGSTPLPWEPDLGVVLAGRYKLLQLLGAGGMGRVFLAEQTNPVCRPVAVKLIRDGMDTARVLARFEAERQALALMDHPLIAKVLDAGTADGRPFFVMELVRGVPLTDYCDSHRLTIHQRLELFQQICGAVQHAHQKGVIHRDLKPSNVLVEERDGRPVPKVIDFGLAKATGDARLADHSLATGIGAVLGTPSYMAPEQAAFGIEDVDTRADIYALGVILYELLTGTTPVPREAIRTQTFDEVLRLVREQEPPTPSNQLARSAERPALASARGTDESRLVRTIRGDLDWVVMKALAKDRDRRYESAAALGQDVGRYLAHEPVSASPPSIWYQTRKFVRRHRVQVAAAALVVLALKAAVVGTAYGLTEANRKAEDAAKAADDERKAKEEASRRADQFRRLSHILATIFSDIDRDSAENQNRALREVLADRLMVAADQIDAEGDRDSQAVALLQHRLGKSLVSLGYPERAVRLHEKALATLLAVVGPDSRSTLEVQNSLAEEYRAARRPADSIRLHEDTLARFKTQFGPDHEETLTVQQNLALSYDAAGRTEDAIKLLEDAVRRRKKVLPPGDLAIASSLDNLAAIYSTKGRLPEAIPLLEESLRLLEAKHNRGHLKTVKTMSNLAYSYWKSGRVRDAIPLQEQALTTQRAELGENHPETLVGINHLGEQYLLVGRTKEGITLLEDSYRRSITRLGAEDPDTVTRRGNLARAYTEVGRGADAVPLFAAFVPAQRKKYGDGTPRFAVLLAMISVDLVRAGQFAAAEPYLRESLSIKEKALPNAWETADVKSLLGEALLGQEKYAEAGPLLEAGYLGVKARAATIAPVVRRMVLEKALDRLIRHSELTKQPAATARWSAERTKLPPELAPRPRPARPLQSSLAPVPLDPDVEADHHALRIRQVWIDPVLQPRGEQDQPAGDRLVAHPLERPRRVLGHRHIDERGRGTRVEKEQVAGPAVGSDVVHAAEETHRVSVDDVPGQLAVNHPPAVGDDRRNPRRVPAEERDGFGYRSLDEPDERPPLRPPVKIIPAVPTERGRSPT